MRLSRALAAMLAGVSAVLAGPALAHPHVWVTAKSELVFDAKGRLSAVRHAWTFDEAFSATAAEGLDKNGDAKLSREELAPLAEVNVTSLADFDFFTFAEAAGKPVVFSAPVDYWLDQSGASLTLHFTLPVQEIAATPGAIKLEIYDPSYFVDFALADTEPARLVGAPAGCRTEITQAGSGSPVTSQQKLSESFFNDPTASSGIAAQSAPKIAVRCG